MSAYNVGSISSILGSGTSTEVVSGLSKLFSASSQQSFARVAKLEELAPRIKSSDKVKEEENKRAGKKRKWTKEEKALKRKDPDAPTTTISVTEIAAIPPASTTSISTKLASGSESQPEQDVSGIDIIPSNIADERSECTVFLGNVPLTENAKTIKKLLQDCGEIVSIRLRSVPVAGTAVDDAGNQDLVRKICSNAKKFGEQKGSFNAYVVFKEESAVEKAVALNNTLINGRHLRVDKSKPTLFDPNRTVFLGALPHYGDEEELRQHFAAVLPNGQDDIESIRIIRDKNTLVGSGIGYLLLRDRDAVMKALSLHEVKFRNRFPLRVTVCGKRTKKTEKKAEKKPAATGPIDTNKKRARRALEGSSEDNKTSEKPADKPMSAMAINAIYAESRIKLKSTVTRKKTLVSKGQMKSRPGVKGKRLGGVVKRAMKAAAPHKKH